jgi:hypothetical protein
MSDVYEKQVMPLQEAKHAEWLDQARAIAFRLAKQKGVICVDDIRDELPPPAGVDGRIMGAIFKPSSVWERVDFRQSWRKETHGRPISLFRLKDDGP